MSWEKQKERDKKEIWNGKNWPKNNKQTKETSPNFGLWACTKIKYSTFLCLILRKSIRQVKNCIFSKTEANLAS